VHVPSETKHRQATIASLHIETIMNDLNVLINSLSDSLSSGKSTSANLLLARLLPFVQVLVSVPTFIVLRVIRLGRLTIALLRQVEHDSADDISELVRRFDGSTLCLTRCRLENPPRPTCSSLVSFHLFKSSYPPTRRLSIAPSTTRSNRRLSMLCLGRNVHPLVLLDFRCVELELLCNDAN
jgi:hypothetical protein